jgi:hypothetical protein
LSDVRASDLSARPFIKEGPHEEDPVGFDHRRRAWVRCCAACSWARRATTSSPTGKVKVYDFSGDTIEGDLIKPEGSTVDAR